jgi:hypothetical protein
VINILSREQGQGVETTPSESGSRYRRNSRNRSRSQLDLTVLNAAVSKANLAAALATGVEEKSAMLRRGGREKPE